MRPLCSDRWCARRRPRLMPICSTVLPVPASVSWRGGSPPSCLADGASSPETVAERVQRDSHPDLTWVRASGAAEMLVGDIEGPVVAAASMTPFESARRVFVIEGAERMNDQAANRLLKTLEEPPPFAHLVLLSDRVQDVLPTIVSRCQRVRFDPPPPELIEASLEGVEPQRARACARLALGDAALAQRLAGAGGAAAAHGGRGLRARGARGGDRLAAVGGGARGRARGRRERRRGGRGSSSRRSSS